MRVARAAAVVFTAVAAFTSAATAQLRIAQWNITNWDGTNHSRDAAFQTSFYGQVPVGLLYAGKSMAPDVLIAQEIYQGGAPAGTPCTTGWLAADREAKRVTGQNNVNAFLKLLNNTTTPPNPNITSPGDWAAAPYIANQGDTGNALFYRTSKFTLVGMGTPPNVTYSVTLGTLCTDVCGAGNCGDQTNQAPRDNQRWQIRVLGYSGAAADLYLYAGHLKASDGSPEWARKVPEATRIRNDAAALPAGSHFILGADLNVQTSSRNYYQILVGAGTGQFLDPINKPGSWNNTCAFRNIHTQEPTPAPDAAHQIPNGGVDDRHDQLLISAALRDGQGLSYIPYTPGGNILASFIDPAANCPSGFTATAWFDPNHSYRCWGNDGNHFNLGIINNIPVLAGDANTQVGSTIAAALVTTCQSNGHLPVYLDLQVPAKLGAPSGMIDLGTVAQSSTVSYSLQIANAADLPRFSKDATGWGIDSLTYSLGIVSTSFSISGGLGPFERTATNPAQLNTHSVALNTSTIGPKSATITITSDDPDSPTRVIMLTATVAPTGACCATAGSCSILTQAACASASGTYIGDNSACVGNPCGRCCDGSGNCLVQTQTICIGGGHTFMPNTFVCSPNPCVQPTGACCVTGACTTTASTGCAGQHQGNGTSCTPNPCPQPTGACCTAADCTIVTQAACNTAGGMYQGNTTACNPIPCTGACCTIGNCASTTQAACTGEYQGNTTTCNPVPCTGACCAADGQCTAVTEIACAGSYQGNGTNCSPNPCPQLGACCSASSGDCSLALRADCADVWNGTASCQPNPCQQPTGACCIGAACSATVLADCTGSFQGPGVLCGTPGNPIICCPANFNTAGGVNVADIFAFLSAWFAQGGQVGPGLTADFNGDLAVNVTDIFAFLGAWFAGCT